MSARITHIRKPDRDNRFEAISHYGQLQKDGKVHIFEREWFIDWLKTNNTYAYVNEDGNEAVCDIKDNGRIRYLQTRPDASEENNLLSLPGC